MSRLMTSLQCLSVAFLALGLLPGCSKPSQENPTVQPEPAASVATLPSAAEPAPSAVAEPVAPSPKPVAMPRLRPLGANQVAAVLIRTKVKYPAKPEEWTRLIHSDGKVSSKKGAFLFIDGELHRFRRQEKVSVNPPCPGESTNPFPKRIWRNAEFVPEKKGKKIEVVKVYKPNPTPEEGEMVHTEVEHELVGVLPGYAFLKTSITDYGCGAHALYGNEFVLVAFGSEGKFERVEPSEYSVGSDAGIEKAIAKFNAQVSPRESPDSLDGPMKREDVTVSMAYPVLTPSGSDWTVLYTGPATWAGSYGGWGGYSRSVPVALDAPPARFRDSSVVPEVVADYVGKHDKDEEVFGFTLGEISDAK